ncbi:hypothetical protein KI688_005866 [Linnemannia hyalina]|uniref:Uncharacterized protein n=1 Tax=Linnemannia hyalina TaxID=64524 RepID=A0A9P7Y4I9_9FUNG|nr:hypothetical protein KI688_005866 [Linnemannia hyalina]
MLLIGTGRLDGLNKGCTDFEYISMRHYGLSYCLVVDEMLEKVGEDETDEQTVFDVEEGVVVDKRLEDKSAVSVVPMGQGKKEKCDVSSPGGEEVTLAEEDERK